MSKPFKGTINVDIPRPVAQGVIFAHGSWSGGPALDVRDNRLHYVCKFVGITEQKVVATEDLPTGNFELVGEGLCVRRDSGDEVTGDNPGTRPYRFTGGVIKRIAVDVSGQPDLNLEREAEAMLARA